MRFIAVAFCACGVAARQDESAVRQATEDLGDRDIEVREAATHTLIGMGESILPTLREALKRSSDPEVRERLEKVIRVLDKPRRYGIGRKETKFVWSTAPDFHLKCAYSVEVTVSGDGQFLITGGGSAKREFKLCGRVPASLRVVDGDRLPRPGSGSCPDGRG